MTEKYESIFGGAGCRYFEYVQHEIPSGKTLLDASAELLMVHRTMLASRSIFDPSQRVTCHLHALANEQDNEQNFPR